jgi:hypothetical protein
MFNHEEKIGTVDEEVGVGTRPRGALWIALIGTSAEKAAEIDGGGDGMPASTAGSGTGKVSGDSVSRGEGSVS